MEDNIDFTREAFLDYQSSVAHTLFGQEADLTDERQMFRLREELFAYISGDIHEGTNETMLRPMFRDFDAVRAAWENLAEENRGRTARSRYSRKDLTKEEEGALLRYKSGESYQINAKLRDEVLLTESEQKIVDELDRALEKLPTHEGVVYRRLSFDVEGQEAVDAFLGEHAAGDIVPYEAYTSSSTAIDGYPVSGELTVTQIITSRTGRDMAGIGNNNESEILFARNTRFYVEKIETDADGKTFIYMEEVTKHGAGQLYSEERVQAMQQMQTSEGEDGELQNVSGVDTRRGADRGGMSGLRAEGDGEEGGIARESRKGFSVDRELDREIRQIVKEAREGGRSEEAVQADIRALVQESYQRMAEQYGTIPAGERPAREARVPRRTAEERVVSQTVRTVLEAGATPEAAIPNIEELTARGVFSYTRYTDKQAMEDAEGVIRDKGYATALSDWTSRVRSGEVSKANTAEGWALYNQAANSGDVKSAMTILTNMVEHQRNAAQAVPTILGQAERTSQGERMTTYTEKNAFLTQDMQYTLGSISGRLPGWDYQQIPYIDAWGRTESTGSTAGRALDNFLNPAYRSAIEESPMELALQELYESTGDVGVLPSRAPRYFNVDGERKDLTAGEYVEYASARGQTAYVLMEELFQRTEGAGLSDEDMVNAVERVYEYANAQAKTQVSSYEPEGWVKKAMDGAASGVDPVDYTLYELAKEMADAENSDPEKRNGSIDQAEAEAAIDMLTGLSDEARAYLWQSTNKGWKESNNPYR